MPSADKSEIVRPLCPFKRPSALPLVVALGERGLEENSEKLLPHSAEKGSMLGTALP